MIKAIIYSLFRLLPICKHSVLFINYYGKSYGCNPKYISEYISESQGKGLKIYWAFNNPDKNQSLSQKYNIIKFASIRYLYVLATSKVICTNYRMTETFKKRSNQVYIQTWHSSLRLKMIEADTEKTLSPNYIKMAKHDSAQIDYLIAGSAKSAETFANSFWYSGNILKVGTPRNDLLLNQNPQLYSQVKKKLGIDPSKKIVLYAPTFREDKNLNCYNIDYSNLCNSLSRKFGGNWVVVKRFHPHLSNLKEAQNDNIINATNYDDIQELLLVADVLITDYSSLMFDYAITHRPIFIYATDLDHYCKNERNLYFDINKLPFLLSKNNEELMASINMFSEENYISNLTQFEKEIGSYEQGNASEKIGKLILNILEK